MRRTQEGANFFIDVSGVAHSGTFPSFVRVAVVELHFLNFAATRKLSQFLNGSVSICS